LGHLDVLNSPLVKKLCESFESPATTPPASTGTWDDPPVSDERLPLVFAVDGSLQIIVNELPPHKTVAFVKTALLRVDKRALAAIDRHMPHPYAIRDLMANAAIYHATVFPLRHIVVPGMSTYDAVRHTIFESIKDASLGGEPMETLKWIAYEKWGNDQKALPPFECPHCESNAATLPYDAERGNCPSCGKELLLSDMLGFHLEMGQDSAPDVIASTYMLIHETLLLFTGIRYFWERKRDVLSDCLFLKDGPLAIRAQYSKLVAPIRRFFQAAQATGIKICVVGQEKTGAFADHLALIGRSAPEGKIFIPSHDYIRQEIQHRPIAGAPYGKDTNYGAKLFYKVNERHQMVLNVPTGAYIQDPSVTDLIGADRIFGTLPELLSSRFEGGLYPIELANNVASLSTYPSAKVLALFAEAFS
jgi:hypothetical protein